MIPLADHLWQSTAFAALAGLIPFTLRQHLASLRHWVLLTAIGTQLHWRTAPGIAHLPVPFHPAVWWIGARLLKERERACDEAVLRSSSGWPHLNVCRRYLESPLPCVAGVTRSHLKRRIQTILENRKAHPLHQAAKGLLAAAAAGSLLAPIAIGLLNAPVGFAQDQAASLPEFDVASVKLFHPGSAPEDRHISAAHGVLTARQQSLRECIEWAYSLKESSQLTGPGSLEADEYDILAKTKDGVSEPQIRLMLQRLLADRFKLSLHRTTEQKSVYSLVQGKDGPSQRMKPVDREPERGFHMNFADGFMTYRMVGKVEKLAMLLPTFLDIPVVDKTGLTAVYEFQLKVEMDDPRPRMPQPGEVFQGFGMTPGVFPAVEELGLKLVKEKGPVEVLVVDHVERPSAN